MTTMQKAIQAYRAGRPVAEPEDITERMALRRLISTEFKALITAKAAATDKSRNAIAEDAAKKLRLAGRIDGGDHWARNAFGAGRITDEAETKALAAALGVPVGEIDAHLRLAPWTAIGRRNAGTNALIGVDGRGAGQASTVAKTPAAPQPPAQPTQSVDDADAWNGNRAAPAAEGLVEVDFDTPDKGDECMATSGMTLSAHLVGTGRRPRDLKRLADALEITAARLRKAARHAKKQRGRDRG